MTPLLLLPHPISQPICIPAVLILVTRGWGQLWASPQAFITTPFSFLDPRLLKSSLFLLSLEIHSTEPLSPVTVNNWWRIKPRDHPQKHPPHLPSPGMGHCGPLAPGGLGGAAGPACPCSQGALDLSHPSSVIPADSLEDPGDKAHHLSQWWKAHFQDNVPTLHCRNHLPLHLTLWPICNKWGNPLFIVRHAAVNPSRLGWSTVLPTLLTAAIVTSLGNIRSLQGFNQKS